METVFNTKTTYGDDNKYIKTKIETYKNSITTNFYNKKGSRNTRRKNTTYMFIDNNSKFYPLCI